MRLPVLGAGLPLLALVACAASPQTTAEEVNAKCTYRFAYKDRGERSVEVRGDFREDGWRAGVPMRKEGGTWIADVDLPAGRVLEYKLLVDGARWTADPANPSYAGGNS